MHRNNKKEFIIYILTLCYMIPFGILLLANTAFSLFQTTYMELYLDTEKPLYKADSPLLLLILTFLFLLLCAFFLKKKPLSEAFCKKLELFVLLYAGIFCLAVIFLFKVRVSCDSKALSDLAIAFMNKDYSSFTGDNYLAHYPHQLGMIGYLQLVYTLFGIENFTVLQFFNIFAVLSVVYFMHRITDELFHDTGIQFMLSVLCTLLLPLYLYVTFIYGDIPGLGLVVPVIYLVIRYMHTGNKKLLIPAAVCMALSMILKSNNTVILAATIIVLILHTIRKKDFFALIFAMALILLPNLGNACINTYYANAAGLEKIPSGIPKIAWVAMGLQENDYLENGWYNSYNWNIYTQNNFDSEETTEACMESIKASVNSFVEAPRSGIHFFYKKFISQWNHPDYHAMLTNEWYSRHRDDHTELAISLIYGEGRKLLDELMNVYHFIALLGASIFSVKSCKKWSLSSAYLTLCVFGGYFFHMFWEASARYALGYFVLCIPMAAYGLVTITNFLQKLFFKSAASK